MLHVILLILKIIGIVLLVILGLLLAVILVVLLVPFRYRIQGGYHEKPKGGVRVTWLLHALSVAITYDEKLDVLVKVLIFKVFHLSLGDQEDSGEDEFGEEELEQAFEDAAKEAIEASADALSEAGSEPVESVQSKDKKSEADKGSAADKAQAAQTAETGAENADMASQGVHHTGIGSNGAVAEIIDVSQVPTIQEEMAQESAVDESADGGEDPFSDESDFTAGLDEDDRNILEKIQYLFSQVCDKLEMVDEKRRWIMAFLKDSRNQKSFLLIWRQIKAILKHIVPTRAKGDVRFGFDDPATTGQVLSACSVVYALYGSQFVFTPDFENSVIEGDVDLKGRIRLGSILVRVLRVLVHRNLWRMIKQIRKFLRNGGN